MNQNKTSNKATSATKTIAEAKKITTSEKESQEHTPEAIETADEGKQTTDSDQNSQEYTPEEVRSHFKARKEWQVSIKWQDFEYNAKDAQPMNGDIKNCEVFHAYVMKHKVLS